MALARENTINWPTLTSAGKKPVREQFICFSVKLQIPAVIAALPITPFALAR